MSQESSGEAKQNSPSYQGKEKERKGGNSRGPRARLLHSTNRLEESHRTTQGPIRPSAAPGLSFSFSCFWVWITRSPGYPLYVTGEWPWTSPPPFFLSGSHWESWKSYNLPVGKEGRGRTQLGGQGSREKERERESDSRKTTKQLASKKQTAHSVTTAVCYF